MKKILSIVLILIFVCSAFASCSKPEENKVESNNTSTVESSNTDDNTNKKLNVVATIFPQYDFVRQIAGDNVDLTMLLPPGSESHSFEPTPQDIIKIQECDVFIYVGGDSDSWIDDILESMDTSKMKIVSLMDLVNVVEEEIVEGMEDDHGHSHGDEEFDAADVNDRPMSDFSGAWISGVPIINDGSLDKYIEHGAEEAEVTAQEQKEKLLTKWASEYDNITLKDDTLEIDGKSAKYDAQGYQIVESDHGSSVWYKYQIQEQNPDLPSYLIFNDHGYGKVEDEHHDSEDHEEEHHEEIGHIHFKYGNDSFDALINDDTWSPFYFDSTFSNKEIGEFMAGHEEHGELDEHVWTSPKNAKIIVEKLSETLCDLDPANTDILKQNTVNYVSKLDELDKSFTQVVSDSTRKTLIFGDRFPFRYFADSYGLEYFAAFPGCSTETEPSAATVAFLIDKVNEQKIPVVFHIELSNEKMADTICESTDAKKLLLHSCHNLTKADFESGVTYLDLMTQNVENLKEALM